MGLLGPRLIAGRRRDGSQSSAGRLGEIVSKHARLLALAPRYERVRRRVVADPTASAYRDQALTPVSDDETGTLEIFNATDSARAAVQKAKRQKPPRPLRAVGT
jgi:hypothetical protein